MGAPAPQIPITTKVLLISSTTLALVEAGKWGREGFWSQHGELIGNVPVHEVLVNDGPVNEDSIGHVQGDGEDGLDGLEKADPGLLRQP